MFTDRAIARELRAARLPRPRCTASSCCRSRCTSAIGSRAAHRARSRARCAGRACSGCSGRRSRVVAERCASSSPARRASRAATWRARWQAAATTFARSSATQRRGRDLAGRRRRARRWAISPTSASLAGALAGVEVVYNIAALYRQAGAAASHLPRASTRRPSGDLVEAAAAAGVRRVVHCSTVGVHGDIEHPPANEDAPLRPGDIYQATKVEGERLAREAAARAGVELTIARPTASTGPATAGC